MGNYINIEQLSFSYLDQEGQVDAEQALTDITLGIEKGEHIAILGRNGSGKSTLARLINGLEIPLSGTITVAGYDTRDEEESWSVRQRCGMVFQNPDNQIVATTVEEDVAFGPENLGMPSEEIRIAVDEALAYVGLSTYAKKAPTELSGGQKQKLAIAGILAMKPECIILDEATSMLDPEGRQQLMDLVLQLQRERGLTIINITHNMIEASMADRVIVLHEGRVLLEGSPAEIFHYVDEIRGIGLDVPVHTAIARSLTQDAGIEIPVGAAATADSAEAIIREYFNFLELPAPAVGFDDQQPQGRSNHLSPNTKTDQVVIQAEALTYSYNADSYTPEEAIQDIHFDVREGEFFGIMGHSGSGKSTLIQHLNGLLRIQKGQMLVLDRDVRKVKDIRDLRRHVQVLFQYPEHQLFADTVYDDISFGPKKLAVATEQIDAQVREACRLAGVKEEWLDRSPFELSGGEKRRVALAGILAMKPSILILDEPAAGLDPVGREEILSYFSDLHRKGVTVVMVSHSMEDLARLCDRILVLNHGRRVMLDTAAAIFDNPDAVTKHHLAMPATKSFLERFRVDLGEINSNCFTIESAVAEIGRHIQVKGAKE